MSANTPAICSAGAERMAQHRNHRLNLAAVRNALYSFLGDTFAVTHNGIAGVARPRAGSCRQDARC
jgi:hypothetical protein